MARQTPENVLEFLRGGGGGWHPRDKTIPSRRELQSLASGSLATLSKPVAGYRAALTQAEQEPVPAAFKAIFDRATESAWSSAAAELRAELAAVKAELKDAREAVAEQTVRAKVAGENAVHLTADIRRLRDELAAAREAKAEAVGALKALTAAGGLKEKI